MTDHVDVTYRKALRGHPFTGAEATHLEHCRTCQLAIQRARGLDSQLRVAARDLAAEPMPPDLLAVVPRHPQSAGWAPTAAVILLAAVAVGWAVSSALNGVRLVGSHSPSAVPSDALATSASPTPFTSPTPARTTPAVAGPSLALVSDPDLSAGGLSSVTYADGLILAGGSMCGPSSCTPLIAVSRDGHDWQAPLRLPGEGRIVSIVHGEAGWVAAGESAIWFSPDATSWERADGDFVHGLADGGPRYQAEGGCCGVTLSTLVSVRSGFVAVGHVSCFKCKGRAAVWRSADGRSWERLQYQPTFSDAAGSMRSVVVMSNGRLVASGDNSAWTSDDQGRTWELRRGVFPGFPGVAPSLVATSAGEVLAIAATVDPPSGYIWRSSNGIDWRGAPISDLASSEINAVAEIRGTTYIATKHVEEILNEEERLLRFNDDNSVQRISIESADVADIAAVAGTPSGLVAVGSRTSNDGGDASIAIWIMRR